MDNTQVCLYQRNHGDMADMRLNVAPGVSEGFSSKNDEFLILREASSGDYGQQHFSGGKTVLQGTAVPS